MQIPLDDNERQRAWATMPTNDALLYFVQLMEEMVAHPTIESLRAVSLDSYHRLREIDRVWREAERAQIIFNLPAAIEELVDYLGRDPIVLEYFAESWLAVQPRLKATKGRPKEAVEAIRYLSDKFDPHYLRRCRDYIGRAVGAGKAKQKRDFRFVVENYCSYLANMGYHDRSIYYRVRRIFFDAEVIEKPLRALQDFFGLFPHNKERLYRVAFAVSSEFANLLTKHHIVGPSADQISDNLRIKNGTLRQCREHTPKDLKATSFWNMPGQCFQVEINALDENDARVRCESDLAVIRAVSYTAVPFAELEWDDAFAIQDKEKGARTVLSNPFDVVRVGRKRVLHGLATNLEARFKFFLDEVRDDDDRNRLFNAVTIYS